MVKVAAGFFILLLAASACDTKVKQQRPPRIPDDPAGDAMSDSSDSDIAAEPEAVVPVEKKKTTKQQRRHRCCTQCLTGLKEDKSGDKPDNIPCQDFTVHVKGVCLKWFHKNPMKASEAQACVDEGPGTSDDDTAKATAGG